MSGEAGYVRDAETHSPEQNRLSKLVGSQTKKKQKQMKCIKVKFQSITATPTNYSSALISARGQKVFRIVAKDVVNMHNL